MKKINVLICALVLSGFAYALPEDSGLPINITSDTGGYDHQKNEGYYEGDVVLVQGTLEILADYAEFKMVDDELDVVVANGNLIKIKYLPELNKPWVFGEGKILEYFPKKNLLVLRQSAKVTQDDDIAVADRIEYNTVLQKVKAMSEKSADGRVSFEIKLKGK